MFQIFIDQRKNLDFGEKLLQAFLTREQINLEKERVKIAKADAQIRQDEAEAAREARVQEQQEKQAAVTTLFQQLSSPQVGQLLGDLSPETLASTLGIQQLQPGGGAATSQQQTELRTTLAAQTVDDPKATLGQRLLAARASGDTISSADARASQGIADRKNVAENIAGLSDDPAVQRAAMMIAAGADGATVQFFLDSQGVRELVNPNREAGEKSRTRLSTLAETTAKLNQENLRSDLLTKSQNRTLALRDDERAEKTVFSRLKNDELSRRLMGVNIQRGETALGVERLSSEEFSVEVERNRAARELALPEQAYLRIQLIDRYGFSADEADGLMLGLDAEGTVNLLSDLAQVRIGDAREADQLWRNLVLEHGAAKTVANPNFNLGGPTSDEAFITIPGLSFGDIVKLHDLSTGTPTSVADRIAGAVTAKIDHELRIAAEEDFAGVEGKDAFVAKIVADLTPIFTNENLGVDVESLVRRALGERNITDLTFGDMHALMERLQREARREVATNSDLQSIEARENTLNLLEMTLRQIDSVQSQSLGVEPVAPSILDSQ